MSETVIPGAAASGVGLALGKRHLALNVRVLMAQRGYRNVRSLYLDVLKSGADISYSQFARIVDNQSEKLNLAVVNALLNLFDCSVMELIIETRQG
ncbi:helix-turn-helix transcriptional regulator [Chitinimonas sp.]|uniref:helix-turn-helix domain-containing protein n=1 Tax=Chitinimonas sp. TaxID=1934313 RepID=UPI002F920710